MKNRSLVLLLVLTLILGSVAFSVQAEETYTDIFTKADLIAVQNDLSGHYRLMNDLTFTAADFESGGICYNGGKGFLPIGTSANKPFSGTFDGQGFAIRGLAFDQTLSYAGLFGYTVGVVRNVTVEDCHMVSTVSSYDLVYVGGVAGYNKGTITNCYVSGTVQAISGSHFNNAYGGGIAGYCEKGTIQNCRTTCNLLATTISFTPYHDFFVGGIAGYAKGSTIADCTATGTMSADRVGGLIGMAADCTVERCWNAGAIITRASELVYAGGLIGRCERCIVHDCYNIGTVTAKASSHAFAGGLIGEQEGGQLATCYNLAVVSATAGSANRSVLCGGIVGLRETGTVTNCYYADVSSQKTENGFACSSADMMQAKRFDGFDFQNVWIIESGRYAYPQLRTCAMTAEFNGPTATASATVTTTRPTSQRRTTSTTTVSKTGNTTEGAKTTRQPNTTTTIVTQTAPDTTVSTAVATTQTTVPEEIADTDLLPLWIIVAGCAVGVIVLILVYIKHKNA